MSGLQQEEKEQRICPPKGTEAHGKIVRFLTQNQFGGKFHLPPLHLLALRS